MSEHTDGATLDEERLARMRQGVMHDVHLDVARRGRRTRRVVGGVAAACVVVLVGGIGSSLVVAPLSTSDSASSDSASSSSAADSGAEASSPERSADGDDNAAGGLADVEVSGRQVVTTGSATVEVTAPEEAADELAAWVEAAGGRVDRRSEYESDEGRDRGEVTSASLVLRIPADATDRAVAQLRRYGTVTALDVARDDVTAQVADLDARIRSLTTSVERLREILADADDAADLLDVERSLSERQADLESLQAQRRSVGDQVSLSTLSVDLVARDGAESVDPGGFTGGLQSGWNALVSVVNRGVELVGVLLPWLALGLVAWLLWRFLGRARRRR